MATIILGVMGGMGALLAITGIFGMAAYSVSKRLRELGIRIALGAQRKEVLKQPWDAPSGCWRLVRPQGCYWEFWRAGCSPSSCIRRLLGDPLVLAGLWSRCRFWACSHVDSSTTRAVD